MSKKKLKKKVEPSNAINEWMKFSLGMAMTLGLALAYKKGYDDAEKKHKMRYGGKKNE